MAETKQNTTAFQPDDIKVRLAQIEIDSVYFDEYLAILKKEAAESVRLEEGVLCIFPMYKKEHPTEIRLLEIYADEAAYQVHLKTPHFVYYKEATAKMVNSLKLIDMKAIDQEMMSVIFKKLE